ncbi:MAG: hypothetical protein QM784_05355 [Polyangiaceae bacterium]
MKPNGVVHSWPWFSVMLLAVSAWLPSCGGSVEDGAGDGDTGVGGSTAASYGGSRSGTLSSSVGGLRNFGGSSWGGSTVIATGGAGGVTGGNECFVDGKWFSAGAIISGDPCSSCVCLSGGGVACSGSGAAPPPPVARCVYGGVDLASGDVVPSLEGCATCTCTASTSQCSVFTQVICEPMNCTGSCSYAGWTYANGATFPATDGCNSCRCSAGKVSCTEVGCACNPNSETWRYYELHDPTSCASAGFTCPSGTVRFDNQCGCGCEQSLDCPDAHQCASSTWSASEAVVDVMIPVGSNTRYCAGATVCPIVQSYFIE